MNLRYLVSKSYGFLSLRDVIVSSNNYDMDVIMASRGLTDIKAWIGRMWDVFTHRCLNCKGGLSMHRWHNKDCHINGRVSLWPDYGEWMLIQSHGADKFVCPTECRSRNRHGNMQVGQGHINTWDMCVLVPSSRMHDCICSHCTPPWNVLTVSNTMMGGWVGGVGGGGGGGGGVQVLRLIS